MSFSLSFDRPALAYVRHLPAATLFVLSALTLQAAEGSQIQIAAAERGSLLEVRWTNSSSSSLLVNLGGMLGPIPLYAVKFEVSGPKLPRQSASVRGLAAIEGRVDPWVVILPANAEYVIKIALDDVLLTRGGTLADHNGEDWLLKASFAGKPAFDYAPGGRKINYSITRNGETSIPCWTGSLTTVLTHHAAR